MKFLDPLYHGVAVLLVGIHTGLTHVPGLRGNGVSWALSIVFLTISMRLVLFPVFVKQIRNQRAMQTLQPKMKELQAKYKNDKEKLNTEMMALWKEHGANPLSGCLPLLLQIPIFVSLFHTLREIKPIKGCVNTDTLACYAGKPGFSQAHVYSAAHAKIFGVPISASFTSSTAYLHALTGSDSHTATRILCLVLTLLMGASTFITQRQLMSQNSASGGSSQMAQQQKILLYVFPIMFLFYGFKFPIGVLLYWLTTNVWSMAQQRVVIRRMEPAPAGPAVLPAGPAPGAKPNKPAPGAKPSNSTPTTTVATANDAHGQQLPGKNSPPKSSSSGGKVVLPPLPGGAIPTPPQRPGGAQRPANRSKNRKKGRR